MKKFRRSKRALSPVVASIILIAVTVAVSIAVAAWMGALTVGFMGSSSITITNVDFQGTSASATNDILITLKNTGTKVVVINTVKVNDATANVPLSTWTGTNSTIAVGEDSKNFTITDIGWVAGNPYKFELYDASNQVVGSYQQTATGT
jgi:flagellin-like protein